MYRVRCSIKYQLGGICTAKLNLLSKQQRSILVLRLLDQTELVSSGNRCLISSTELHTRIILPTHHHGISSIGRFTYTESSSLCFSQSGGDIRFNFLIQDGKQHPGDSTDLQTVDQISNQLSGQEVRLEQPKEPYWERPTDLL